MKDILIRDIMINAPYTLNVKDSFSKVAEYFRRYRIRHLPIVDNKKLLCGIITQRDLYRICSPRKTIAGQFVYDKSQLDRYILRHVMTKSPVALGPRDTFAHLLDVMVRTKHGCIPVVNKERRLLGIVTQIDVLRTVQGSLSRADTRKRAASARRITPQKKAGNF